jgi:hypothetical protein
MNHPTERALFSGRLRFEEQENLNPPSTMHHNSQKQDLAPTTLEARLFIEPSSPKRTSKKIQPEKQGLALPGVKTTSLGQNKVNQTYYSSSRISSRIRLLLQLVSSDDQNALVKPAARASGRGLVAKPSGSGPNTRRVHDVAKSNDQPRHVYFFDCGVPV